MALREARVWGQREKLFVRRLGRRFAVTGDARERQRLFFHHSHLLLLLGGFVIIPAQVENSVRHQVAEFPKQRVPVLLRLRLRMGQG